MSVTEAARTLKIGRSTAYEALSTMRDDEQAARAELDAMLAALPADARPAPSVAPYLSAPCQTCSLTRNNNARNDPL
ncbi:MULTISPECIES: hypothetical protein [Actinomadura]|uniref:Helix-turn-helix domain-containing protein n=1 Tax=Actinomadura yumaensis TaxID=111807 RepID=A0ABW2CFY4_9ACTN|nr:hypothetical protein [Actinomadura sp. J1-007]MWK35625.1 hypothetical protein [Actinomadura sp. J1-007]